MIEENFLARAVSSDISRRSLLQGMAGFAALQSGLFLFEHRAHAAIPTPFVKRVVRTPANTYFTYPHSHGFLSDGRAVVANPTNTNGKQTGIDYLAVDLNANTAQRIAHVDEARWYYCISENNLMAVPASKGRVVLVDLNQNGAQRVILNDPNRSVSADIDISKDGSQVLISRQNGQADGQVDMIDVASARIQGIFSKFLVDHQHFSPYDQSWICFCDNRPNNHDRMWVWNAQQAPQGRHIFDEAKPDGKFMDIGHERAMFHKRALLTVAYNLGEGPRGLYEVEFDGKVRLVSESNSDLHCNISHDGRWAVVSAQGRVVDDNNPNRLDLMKMPVANWFGAEGSYGDSDVTLVNMRTGARRFLYRGTNAAAHQPYEVQPSVSSDDRWVLLKDAREQCVLALEIDQDMLESFLRDDGDREPRRR